jgi:hypothetical protein
VEALRDAVEVFGRYPVARIGERDRAKTVVRAGAGPHAKVPVACPWDIRKVRGIGRGAAESSIR